MDKLIEIKFGSHLYGTDTPESDLDLKGIYLPEGREIVLHTYGKTINIHRQKAEKERNTKDDVDKEYFSLDRFLDLLMEGQTVALDLLFAPESSYLQPASTIFNEVYHNRKRLLTKNVAAFVGYARQQAAKYGIKGSRMDAVAQTMEWLNVLPLYDRLEVWRTGLDELIERTKELVTLEKTPLIEIVQLPARRGSLELMPYLQVCGRKMPLTATVKLARECYGSILEAYGERAKKAHLDGGIDWKALSHAVRVNDEAKELLLTGHITFPLVRKDHIVAIKKGLVPYEQVATEIETGLAELYEAQAKSTLPSEPDRKWAADFLYKVYRNRILETA